MVRRVGNAKALLNARFHDITEDLTVVCIGRGALEHTPQVRKSGACIGENFVLRASFSRSLRKAMTYIQTYMSEYRVS